MGEGILGRKNNRKTGLQAAGVACLTQDGVNECVEVIGTHSV